LLKKLGIKEQTEEEKAAGRQVIKVETVDRMFEFKYKDTIVKKILRPFRRLRNRYNEWRRRHKCYRLFKEQLTEYYLWSIMSFLPLFIRHLELYIQLEKKHGHSAQEWRDYKISTAQEALDIIRRLVDENYNNQYLELVEAKWGEFPYKKTTYANGNTGFEHMTPDG